MSISRARRSVSLPFPSSPHWVPTTTVAGTRLSVRSVASDYAQVYPSPKSGYEIAGFRHSGSESAGGFVPRGRGIGRKGRGRPDRPGAPRGPEGGLTVANELQDVRVAF